MGKKIFFATNFPEMDNVGDILGLKIRYTNQLVFSNNFLSRLHVFSSSVAPWQNGGAYTNLLMSIQIV